ncbi:MAG: glutamate racemase [Lachnospiraceae bacterium]|nr:glutamate racemase [Lachnospiraceae bacterium]
MGDERPIAVFDSGVGGISVLAELIRRMPQESYLYFGDTANAPYGSRTSDEVRMLTHKHIGTLLSEGAKAAVVACNTATGAAIASLRETYPDVPMIGIEPAVKPAAEAFPHGRILVMATPVTLSSGKFRNLSERWAGEAEICPVPCRDLARMIEGGIVTGDILEEYLHKELDEPLSHGADAVVLGCTHYPFVREVIRKVTGSLPLFDGGPGTARETERRLRERGMLSDRKTPGIVSMRTSDPFPAHEALCRRLLDSMLQKEID